MLMAITQRQQYTPKGSPMDVLEHRYLAFLESHGVKTIAIPNLIELVDYYFDNFPFQGIVLSGGEDIDPKLYGENIEWPNLSTFRDQAEKRIMEIAVAKKIPVLGICRGMQFINVFFGGKLIKSIKEEITPDHPPGKEHLATLKEAKLVSWLGKREFTINSFHNQGVSEKTLAQELKAFAVAEQHGLIEGLYHPKFPIAGVQWHPERDCVDQETNDKLLKAFVQRELFWKK